jgi:hypothetical protein
MTEVHRPSRRQFLYTAGAAMAINPVASSAFETTLSKAKNVFLE